MKRALVNWKVNLKNLRKLLIFNTKNKKWKISKKRDMENI